MKVEIQYISFVTGHQNTTWLKNHATLQVVDTQCIFPHCQAIDNCGSGDMIRVCHVILQDHVTKIMRLWGLKSLNVSHHSAKFGWHRDCNSGDMMGLICHVISQDHMKKGSCDFGNWNSSLQATNLPSLADMGILNTLSKCPGGCSILHRELKLNWKI